LDRLLQPNRADVYACLPFSVSLALLEAVEAVLGEDGQTYEVPIDALDLPPELKRNILEAFAAGKWIGPSDWPLPSDDPQETAANASSVA
jgi:hypothetical protein